MRPYYPFNSKLFNTTIYSFECPNINDTLSVKACLCKRRQFSSNGAASIQKIHNSTENFIAMVGSVSDTYGDFHPLF